VIPPCDITLAEPFDVPQIAALSRHAVEHNLDWRWTPARVMRSVRDRGTNVAVARQGRQLLGFAILRYLEDEAHLQLLAVQVSHRRRGVGSALMGWLDTTLGVAGIGAVRLEARAGNDGALAFYRALGFRQTGLQRGYYPSGEDAVQMSRRLHDVAAAD
jgi:ribosomal-protein-alanine N-acetyltransferase